MRLELFTPDLANRHEITHAISCEFSYYYNGTGKFTVVLPLDDYNLSIAQQNSILYIVERCLAYEVVEVVVDCDNNEITLNGYSLNNRLERRVVASAVTIVNVETDVYKAVSANLRGLAIKLADKKGLTETIDATGIYGDSLLSAIQPVLSDAGLGQRAKFDYRTKSITWEIYKGKDRTTGLDAVSFVQERGTAPGLIVDKDQSIYKNVCYCTAAYKNGTKFVVQAGTADGNERRELWAEFSGDGQGENENNADFETRVRNYAALQLGSHRDRIGFETDIDGNELGTGYNVGDLVWCVSLRLGLKYKARITGATFAQDANSQRVKITIGEPTLTVLR